MVLSLVVAGLIAINGLYVAAEFGYVAVRSTRLEQLAKQGSRSATYMVGIRADDDRQGRYFATAQLGITAASLALGMYGEHEVAARLMPVLAILGPWSEAGAHGVAMAAAVALLTSLHVVFGEMIPKAIALRHPEATITGVAQPMALTQTLVGPIVAVFNRIGSLVLRALRVPAPSEHDDIMSRSELAMVIAESGSGGLIPQRQQQILLRIFEFAECDARQIMTPRTRMVAYPVDTPEDELATELAASRHTRFPIYEECLDNIVGTLHLKDFVRWQVARDTAFDLRRLARPARLVPERMPARELLEIFRRERGHMAIVIDEYGGTAGLVTLEDVAEELVGEVFDEFDGESPMVEVLAPGLLQVQGEMPLSELAEYVPLPTDLPDVATVGGLLVTLLGRPAAVGDQVRVGGVTLSAQAVRGLAVAAVRVSSEAAADG